jgi:DNA-binding Lrp family transcriptional regulator
MLDDTDRRLTAALLDDGRASISTLAARLGLARATVAARLDRLLASGEILGFAAILKGDAAEAPVRGLMMIEVEGRGTERVIRHLSAMPEVAALHTTNGKWDLVAELRAENLAELDETLRRIRLVDGIAGSETNLLLATRKATRARPR